MSNDEALELKNKGNNCVKEGKYVEAIFHYTHAVKCEPKNFTLYSNRSYAFLKIHQYYHALEDALETISIKPDWAKGYFRKGEVLQATYHFSDALVSYRCALHLLPNDPTIEEAIKQTTICMKKEMKADEQFPWLGAGIGIILGVLIVMADQFTTKPTMNHPIIMALLTISIALLGFGAGKGYRHYLNSQRKGLLSPPIDLFEGENFNDNKDEKFEENEKPTNNHHRYTKAQARQKFKKAKLSS